MLTPILEPVLSYRIKLIAFVITIIGGLFMYLCVISNGSIAANNKLVHNRRALMWFIVPMSTQMTIKVPFSIGKINLKVIDQGWVELLGGQGAFSAVSLIFKKYQIWQSSFITVHLSIIFIFLLIVIFACLSSLNISVTLKLLR